VDVAERDSKAQVSVRGEYNRTFDADAVRVKDDPTQGQYVFVAPDAQQYMLQVTPDTIASVDGALRTIPGFTAFFSNFYYRTTSEQEAELIRATDAFKKGRVKELGTLRHETKQRSLDAEAKRVASNPELAKAVLAQLKQGRSVTPEVASK
jgi:hypothetical protein